MRKASLSPEELDTIQASHTTLSIPQCLEKSLLYEGTHFVLYSFHPSKLQSFNWEHTGMPITDNCSTVICDANISFQ